jgi:SAM-dependent methyltransferase
MGHPGAGAPKDALTALRSDWSVGRYEETASQLLPAAELLVEDAGPLAGERVVDVGCGTGNAALLAAARGAQVTGVDPALRLLDVARARAAAAAVDATFLAGEAAALPLADNSADLMLSVFGVIFAPDPQAAAAELARVTADDGRILLTAWIPGGAISRMNQVAQQAVLRTLGAPRRRHRLPGTTPMRSTSSLPCTASRSPSRNTASPSPPPRRATTSTEKAPTTPLPSPAAKSSNNTAPQTRPTRNCSRSSKPQTKTPPASASPAATSPRQRAEATAAAEHDRAAK